MTNTISPVTDNIYHFPGGLEPQTPAASELPTSTTPIREGAFNVAEKDDGLAETAQALYVDTIASPQLNPHEEVAAGREQVHSAYASIETGPQADRATAERHAAEALLRARAFTDGLVRIREHAVSMEERQARGDYTLVA